MDSYPIGDRTIVLAGNWNSLSQCLLMELTRSGADVGYLSPKSDQATRYCNQLNDERAVKQDYGKCVHIEYDFEDAKGSKEQVSLVAETFGTVDSLIFSHFKPHTFSLENSKIDELTKAMNQNLFHFAELFQGALPYMNSRKRGRVIYITETFPKEIENIYSFMSQGAIQNMLCALSNKFKESNITFNCVNTGLSEESLYQNVSRETALSMAIEEYQKQCPEASLPDNQKVASTMIVLLQTQAKAISGQFISI
jgi:NAD(P)-dependent dehydrogenase (short-subunit alcohol dehydrogenase family)